MLGIVLCFKLSEIFKVYYYVMYQVLFYTLEMLQLNESI